MTINPRTLKVGDEIHRPSKPHMRYFVNAADDLHVEVRDQLWVGVIYTHAELREHMDDAVRVCTGCPHNAPPAAGDA